MSNPSPPGVIYDYGIFAKKSIFKRFQNFYNLQQVNRKIWSKISPRKTFLAQFCLIRCKGLAHREIETGMPLLITLKIIFMKKSLAIFAVAAMFAACNSNPKIESKTSAIAPADTAGLAEFQMQKQQLTEGELIETEGVYDGATNNLNGTAPAVAATTTRRTTSTPAPRRSTTTRRSSGGSGSSGSSGTVAQAPAPAKKGWSKAAKGAAIGGASGAVIGAVVSKKKGKGAIIGGILGAGGGYVIGRAKDKQDGRY